MDSTPQYWDMKAGAVPGCQKYDELLAWHYKTAYLNLLARWADVSTPQSVLKTDLYAEAMCPSRSFLWEILKSSVNLSGIDISAQICSRARDNALIYAPDSSPVFTPCDIRHLPFADGFFDLIVSDSTLDHFKDRGDITLSLKELMRTLKPGGTLIITMDNGSNFTEPLFRLWIRLGLAPFFIGHTYSITELQQAMAGIGMQVIDQTAIIHNPRFFTKAIVAILRRIFPGQYHRWTKAMLDCFDSLENRRTKYLTAQFIAVKASRPFGR